jgi:hypothetical protein
MPHGCEQPGRGRVEHYWLAGCLVSRSSGGARRGATGGTPSPALNFHARRPARGPRQLRRRRPTARNLLCARSTGRLQPHTRGDGERHGKAKATAADRTQPTLRLRRRGRRRAPRARPHPARLVPDRSVCSTFWSLQPPPL